MNETIQEFVDSRGVAMRVDRQNAVIRGAKILGVHSRNGRTYLPEALVEAARLYEEAKVNVNHPKQSPLVARDYQDRIGVLRNVSARPEEGLFADFHFNPKHALAEQLIWDAEHMPQNVGFSHNVQARTARRGDQVVVEAITKVESVDLVADPATTRGLFESACDGSDTGGMKPVADDEPATRPEKRTVPFSLRENRDSPHSPHGSRVAAGFGELSLEDLKRHRPDLVEALAEAEQAELARLRAEVDRLEAARALLEKRALVRRLLSEFGLPDPEMAEGWEKSVVSERFVESLLAAPSDEAMRELVEERAELVRGARSANSRAAGVPSKPRSRDQSQVCGAAPVDAKRFVEAIT